MDIDKIIRGLHAAEEKYKNVITPTFEISISEMAYDCRKAIEYLSAENELLKADNECRKSVIESLRELIVCAVDGIDDMGKAINSTKGNELK